MDGDSRLMKVGLGDGRAYDVAEQFAYTPPIPPEAWVANRPNVQGACDDLMRNIKQRLDTQRFATGVLLGTVTGGGVLQIAPQTVSLFTTGVGNDAKSSGFSGTMTSAETNAGDKGGLTKDGTWFLSFGAMGSMLEPWVTTPIDGKVPLTPRRATDWLNGWDRFGEKAQRLIGDSTWIQVRHGGDNACVYDIGVISDLGEASGASRVKFSQRVPGQFWFFAVPDWSTGDANGNPLTLQVTLPHTLEVEGAVNAPVGASVAFAFRLKIVGVPFCMTGPQGGMCGVPTNGNGMSEDMFRAMLRSELRRMQVESGKGG